MRKIAYSWMFSSLVSLFLVSSAFSAGGVKINGDLTLVKETIDPLRVLYFSNGSSQFSASPWSLNNSDLYYLGGNVGIGKVPTSPLDVNGDIKLLGNLLLTSPSTIMLDNTPFMSINSNFYNISIGSIASQVPSGMNNTSFGIYSLYKNSSGNHNTAVGSHALFNSNSNYNSALGTSALENNLDGYSNTAIGAHTLSQNTSGFGNTGSGQAALGLNTTGGENTAIGFYTLMRNSVASKNTAIGANALAGQSYDNSGNFNFPWDTFNTAIGYSALVYNNPTSDKDGAYNTAVGAQTLLGNLIGSFNTATGFYAGQTNTTGNNNTYLGANTDTTDGTLSNVTAIGSGAKVNASNKVRIGNNSVTVIEGQVAWSNPSDIRLKKDVIDVTYGLDFINQLRPVEFRMKDGNGKIDFGFIAQSIEALIGANYNVLGIGSDSKQTLSLRYTDFIAPMVKAIQEQSKIISEQNQRIKTLEDRLMLVESLLSTK